MANELQIGDRVLLIDRRDRRYFVKLSDGGEFHTHTGVVAHSEIIGKSEGSWVVGTGGSKYLVLRPRLSDVILKMPRGAQVIYPKDLGQILFKADIYPGARVLESGVGSGALSMTLLRAGAKVTGYELRDDFAKIAQQNVQNELGDSASANYDVHLRDVYDGIDGEGIYDRVVLDLPEPWRVVKAAEEALRPGGVLLAYVPSITQVVTFRDALDQANFSLVETTETLERSWYIEGQAVRPDHRMVAHTGFLTAARLVSDRTGEL